MSDLLKRAKDVSSLCPKPHRIMSSFDSCPMSSSFSYSTIYLSFLPLSTILCWYLSDEQEEMEGQIWEVGSRSDFPVAVKQLTELQTYAEVSRASAKCLPHQVTPKPCKSQCIPPTWLLWISSHLLDLSFSQCPHDRQWPLHPCFMPC